MMNKSFTFLLAVLLLLQSFPFALAADKAQAFDPEKDCPEGKCVEDLIALVKMKASNARKDGCLPKVKDTNPEEFYKTHSFPVSCMRQLKEIEEINEKLLAIKRYLEGVSENDGTCKDCKTIKSPADGLLSNLNDINKTNQELACTEKRKTEVWNKCGADVTCFMVSSANPLVGVGAWVGSVARPGSTKVGSCDVGEDNCFGQILSTFSKSVYKFLESIFDLAWGGIKKGAKNIWHWLKETENKSSTAQFAALKASEEEGFFQQLKNDFPGTMAKVWTGLVAALEHWFSNEIMCQEWSGRAHFSECKRPYQGLGCTSCKTFLNGICGLGGAFFAEAIPAFLTGGLFNAAKYGVKGAAKISKLLKVSPKVIEAAKNTKLAKSINTLKASKVAVAGISAIKKALEAVTYYFVLPATVNVTTAIKSVYQLAKVAGTSVMYTKAGPVIIFGKKVLKSAGKVVIFPIDNPLFNKSFELGGKFTETLLKKGAAKANVARSVAVAPNEAVDKAFVDKTLRQEDDKVYLDVVKSKRPGLVVDTIKSQPSIKLSDIVEEYYPELNYGKTARKTGAVETQKAESELRSSLKKLPAGEEKDRLLQEFDSTIASRARAEVVGEKTTFSRSQVFKNAGLKDDVKFLKGLELIGIDIKKLSPQKIKSLKEAFKKSQSVGDGLFNYSFLDREMILKILQDAGIAPAEGELLLRGGYVGHARAEDLSPTLRRVVVPQMKSGDLNVISSKAEYQPLLKEVAVERRPAVAKALRVLQDSGMTEKAAAETYKRFRSHFKAIQMKVSGKADAEPMLAEYISRQKKAGLSEGAIQKKLDETFGACK